MADKSERTSRSRDRAAKPTVGYRRPPQDRQFQPGTSGNPSGRPKGVKNESTILREIMNRKIETRSGGRIVKKSVLECILIRIADDSLKGNIKSAAFLLNRFGTMVSGEIEPQDLSNDDAQILRQYAVRYLSNTTDKKQQ